MRCVRMRDPHTLKQWDHGPRRHLVGGEAARERAPPAGRAGPRQSVGLRREAESQREDAVAGRALSFHGVRGSDGVGGAARARVHEPKSCREVGAAEGAFSSVLHGGEGLTLWQIIASGWLRLLLVSYMPLAKRSAQKF